MSDKDTTKGYKAFSKGLKCINKQYAENTVFEEDTAVPCECGMHYVINPLDALKYYPLIDDKGDITEFAEVEALDEPVTNNGEKYCTTRLRIGAKLSFNDFVKAAVNFILKKESKAAITNNHARMVNSGDYAQMSSSGNSAQMTSSGYDAQMSSSGNSAQMTSSGHYAQMVSSGDCARMTSGGHYAQMASRGDCARMASSGHYAQIASSGNSAQMTSSGDCAQMVSSGYNARMASSGDCVQMVSSGVDAIVCGTGINCMAKAKKGSWITLAEWGWNDAKGANIPICVKTVQVDGETIKEDTFYTLKNGEFVEA